VRVLIAEGLALWFLLNLPGAIPAGNPKEVKDRS